MAKDREELVAEVNRLYWETETPVTEMAEELGISRRTIYDMLVPAPAAESCPECGGDLVYPNRSARLSGEAVCSVCGRTQDVTLLHELSAAAGAAGAAGTGLAARGRGAVAARPRGAVTRAEPGAFALPPAIAVLVLAGVLVAVLAALLAPARRRRRWWR